MTAILAAADGREKKMNGYPDPDTAHGLFRLAENADGWVKLLRQIGQNQIADEYAERSREYFRRALSKKLES